MKIVLVRTKGFFSLELNGEFFNLPPILINSWLRTGLSFKRGLLFGLSFQKGLHIP